MLFFEGSGYFAIDSIFPLEAIEPPPLMCVCIAKINRQWLFCRRRQFTLRDYFAVSYL